MSWHDRTIPAAHPTAHTFTVPQQPVMPLPVHSAVQLTGGGNLAQIVLDGQTYTLRITRQGKLILTK